MVSTLLNGREGSSASNVGIGRTVQIVAVNRGVGQVRGLWASFVKCFSQVGMPALESSITLEPLLSAFDEIQLVGGVSRPRPVLCDESASPSAAHQITGGGL